MSTATVGPVDSRETDEDEAGTATPTIAGDATLDTEGRSGAGGMGLKGGIAEALEGVLTTIGLPFNGVL